MLWRIIKTITDFPSTFKTTFASNPFSKLELLYGCGRNKLSTREEAVFRISNNDNQLFLAFPSAEDFFASFVC
jgi:hypothetical protein